MNYNIELKITKLSILQLGFDDDYLQEIAS